MYYSRHCDLRDRNRGYSTPLVVDIALMSRPGVEEIQLDLILD